MKKPVSESKARPDELEWDFSCVTSELLETALVWEYARASEKIKKKILHWLDSKNSKGQTVREVQKLERNKPIQFFDPEAELRQMPGAFNLKTDSQILAAENSALLQVPIKWDFMPPRLRNLPPSAKLRRHGVLHDLLDRFGHEFPKAWPQLYAENLSRIWPIKNEDPIHWEPANRLLRYYNRKETVEKFEEILREIHTAEISEQRDRYQHFAQLMIRNLRSMAELELMLDRAFLLEVDFERIKSKDVFLALMDRFWKQRMENKKLARRRRKNVEGKAGLAPWDHLKWLSALRLREHLTINLARETAKKRNNALAKNGQLRLVKDCFDFPNFKKDSGWTNAVKKAKREIIAFEREVLPNFA